jgi:hypothetical protein
MYQAAARRLTVAVLFQDQNDDKPKIEDLDDDEADDDDEDKKKDKDKKRKKKIKEKYTEVYMVNLLNFELKHRGYYCDGSVPTFSVIELLLLPHSA